MSPSSPKNGGDPAKLFAGVSIPWMLMTEPKMSPPLEMRMSNRGLLFSRACQQEANIAKEWLDGTGPSTVLDKADRWEKMIAAFGVL